MNSAPLISKADCLRLFAIFQEYEELVKELPSANENSAFIERMKRVLDGQFSEPTGVQANKRKASSSFEREAKHSRSATCEDFVNAFLRCVSPNRRTEVVDKIIANDAKDEIQAATEAVLNDSDADWSVFNDTAPDLELDNDAAFAAFASRTDSDWSGLKDISASRGRPEFSDFTVEVNNQRASTPLNNIEDVEELELSPIPHPSPYICKTVIELATPSSVEDTIINEYTVVEDTVEEVNLSPQATEDIQILNNTLQAEIYASLADEMFDNIDVSEFRENFDFTPQQIESRRQMVEEEQLRNKQLRIAREKSEETAGNRRERARIRAEENQVGSGSRDDSVVFIARKINDEQYSSDSLNRDVFTTVYNIQHNFSEVDILRLDADIDNLFGDLVSQKISGYNDNDIVSVTIRHNALNSEIYVYAKKKNFNIEDILSAIVEVSQSNKTFLINGQLTIEVAVTKEKLGGRKVTHLPQSVADKRARKTGLIEIRNTDNSCGYMAVALAVFYHEHRNDQTYHERDAMKKNSGGRLKNLARNMFSELNVNIENPMRMSDVQIISDYLAKRKIQLIVVNGHTATKDFDSNRHQETRLYIELYNNHYNVITKIASYFDKNHFCYFCWTGYQNLGTHRCNMCCPMCEECEQCTGADIKCNQCRRTFKGRNCFKNHQKSLCAIRKYCEHCETEYRVRKARAHKCFEYYCKLCGKCYIETPHYCMMAVKNIEKLREEDKQVQFFVAFDIESRLDKHQFISNYSKHTAVLLKSETVCSECFDASSLAKRVPICDVCGIGKQTFSGEYCAKGFCDYLYNVLSPRATVNGRVFVFSHNFRGYDGHFILRDAFERDFAQISPIMKGTKILKLDIGNVRFIDTLSFFQTPLSALPKMFGFENRLLKGYFPYTFNTLENADYIGPIPGKEHFNCARMKPAELSKFNQWYEEKKKETYNLQSEMDAYCENDVDIVLASLMSFKKIMQELTSINPLTRCFTIASIVFEAQRALFLKDNLVGVTPISGYRLKQNSVWGNTCIDLKEKYSGKRVLREYRVGNYYADGYIAEDNTILEYFGCAYHGCPQCYVDNRDTKLFHGKTPNEAYAETMKKVDYYFKLGYRVSSRWDCEFKSEYENTSDLELAEDIHESVIHYKIKKMFGGCDIRGEAFMGGRTNNFRFFYEAKPGEKIRLLDIRSSYPNVMKRRKYWIGHPKSILYDFDESLESYNGFVKAIVVPPPNLYLPILPVKINDKLVFPLCRTCTETRQQTTCTHSEEERWLVWTWTTDTLKLALQHQYKIVRIIHVLHYENETDDLFTGQMNLFGKAKIEASGFPSNVVTEEEKNEYIDNINRYEGILLDFLSITPNPSKRSVSKVSLNANFGKMGQNPNMPQTVVCRDYCTLWNILNNNEYKVKGVKQVTPDVVMLNYKMSDVSKCSPGNTSVAIAAKITDAGREELWKAMNTVVSNGPDRLLYCDTDSVLYIEKEGDTKLEIGPYFGDLTDEIVENFGADAFITRMVACGPKNYAYEVDCNGTTKAVVKLKGIQQDATTLSLVNMEKMLEMVDKYIHNNQEEIKVPQFRIQVDGKTHQVNSFNFNKIYRCVSEKRRICGKENGTVPFGWVGECPY